MPKNPRKIDCLRSLRVHFSRDHNHEIAAMSTRLIPLESAENDPHAAGAAIVFDSGVGKQIAWRVKPGEIITPAIDAAKQYTAQVLEQLMQEGREAEIRHTNWVSVTAAVHKLIRDFNGRQHALRTIDAEAH